MNNFLLTSQLSSGLTPAQLKPIVDSYLSKQKQCNLNSVFQSLRDAYNDYKKSQNRDDLRYLFALCLRSRHGWRMPWVYTTQAVEKLVNSNILNKKFNGFEELYDEVQNIIGNIIFARGDLTLYDTAVNLGQLMNPVIEPKNLVYLAAGARKGAGYVLGKNNVKRTLPIKNFAKLFPNVPNIDIENMLCIYKELFRKLANGETLTQQEIDNAYNPHCFKPGTKKHYLNKMNNCNIFY